MEPPQWSDWSKWDECPVTCGGDIQGRTRECIDDECPDYTKCPGDDSQTRTCGEECCPREDLF